MPPPGPPTKNSEGVPAYSTPRGALASGKVLHVGDLVAFVVAETLTQAKDAAELIEVDYEPLPAHTDTASAMQKNALWEARPNNVALVHEEGDKAKTDAAFAKAAVTVGQRFVINRVTAAAIAPSGYAPFGTSPTTEDGGSPVPLPFGSPPWITKSGITRWNVSPS